MNKSQRTKHTVGIMTAILRTSHDGSDKEMVNQAILLYDQVSRQIDEMPPVEIESEDA